MPLHNKQILAIDDTSSIRTFLRIFLEAQGAVFFEAPNAQKGLEAASQATPDIVVLDLGLPDRDGMEILPDLKKPDADGKVSRVIILSVRKEERFKEQAFELGADAYITKPFLIDELIGTIEKYSEKKFALPKH